MKFCDNQTYEDLEFDVIRSWLEEFAVSPTIKQRLLQLSPVENSDELRRQLLHVNELLLIKNAGQTFPRIEFEELHNEIRLL